MPKNKTLPTIHVDNVDRGLYEALRRYAFETRQSHKAVVEAALREYMARHPWEKGKGREE